MALVLPPPSYKTTIQQHVNRLKRVSEECLEVAFILSNSELEEFGVAKLFDLFDQNFSTAYVLGTGYWPFFSSGTNQSLCICGRFGKYCRHVKNNLHWLDMQAVSEHFLAPRFFPKEFGPIYPEYYNVMIEESTTMVGIYYFKIDMKIVYKRKVQQRDQQRGRYKKTGYGHVFLISIHARFNVVQEYYKPFYNIRFQPNPMYHSTYGTIFKDLLYLRQTDSFAKYNSHDNIAFCFINHMPTTTLLLQNVNLPTFVMPQEITASYPYYMPVRRCNRRRKYEQVHENLMQQNSVPEVFIVEDSSENENDHNVVRKNANKNKKVSKLELESKKRLEELVGYLSDEVPVIKTEFGATPYLGNTQNTVNNFNRYNVTKRELEEEWDLLANVIYEDSNGTFNIKAN